MRSVSVVVDAHLSVDGNLLGHDLVNQILDELTIENTQKKIAKRARRYEWWKLPDDFLLANLDGDTLVMPRGYAVQLKLLLRENNLRVQWVDRRRRCKGPVFKWTKPFEPRIHQPLAVKKMRRHQQGMYQAPTGSGKSLTCVKFIADTRPRKAIVLLDRKGLQSQWIKDFKDWLGEDAGIIGAGKFEYDRRVVVATVQTIWSYMKRDKLPDGFFEMFDCMIADECHHSTAETWEKIIGAFNAKYRIGVSATPDRKDDKFEFALAVLGEVFHEDKEEELLKAGVLVKPRVQMVRTDFQFHYWPSHSVERREHCLVPKCKKSGKQAHSHRDNYQQLKNAIVSDHDRNQLVAEEIVGVANSGKHIQLVISDEIRHLDAIEEAIISTLLGLPIYRLTGKVNGKKREEVLEAIERDDACIILATVAKEGLDIPKIDRIHLPFPSGNPKVTEQKVGRGTRVFDGKVDTVILDYVDPHVKKLLAQFKKRRYGLYEKKGMEVVR